MERMSQVAVFVILCLYTFVTDVRTQQNGDIRLAGPNSNSTHGRVEVFYNNQWGTVCDDLFKVNEAIVVCRQLGHSPVGASVVVASVYGGGTGPIWMDGVSCEGTEARLADCPFGGWNNSDCSHLEDIGVACSAVSSSPVPATTVAPTRIPVVPETGNCSQPDTTIRLQGPTNRRGMGVVQIFRNNQWGNICDNDWDIKDARVVCRMLCYNPADALPGSENFDTSNITEPMVIRHMHCVGTETNISACPQSVWVENSCGSNEMATVTCIPIDYTPVRPMPLLQCADGLLTASFSTQRDPYLEKKHLTIAKPYSEACNLVFGNSTTDVSIGIPFDECGTTRTQNTTHIIYNTTIRYASTYTLANGQITKANIYMIEVKCSLPRDVAPADKPIIPLTETVTQSSQGNFEVALQFFRNNTFSLPVTQFPLEIPLGDWLNVALLLRNVDDSLRLVVHNCTATPTSNRDDNVRYPLFLEKCIEDPTVGFFPLNNTMFGWRYQTFKFIQFGEVHIHCDALVCGQDETEPICDRSCFRSTSTTSTTAATPGSTANPAGRKKRSADTPIRSVHISSSTLIVYDPDLPVEIERPVYTVMPETESPTPSTRITQGPVIITKSTTQTPPHSSNGPITSDIPPTQAIQTPPTSSSTPQTPPPPSNPDTIGGAEEGAINNSGLLEELNVLSKGSVIVFSLFSLTQFLLCITLFYMLI